MCEKRHKVFSTNAVCQSSVTSCYACYQIYIFAPLNKKDLCASVSNTAVPKMHYCKLFQQWRYNLLQHLNDKLSFIPCALKLFLNDFYDDDYDDVLTQL